MKIATILITMTATTLAGPLPLYENDVEEAGVQARAPESINAEIVGHLLALDGFFSRHPEFSYESSKIKEVLLLWQYPFPDESATLKAYDRRDLWIQANP